MHTLCVQFEFTFASGSEVHNSGKCILLNAIGTSYIASHEAICAHCAIYCSSSRDDVLKVNTVSDALGDFSYTLDEPVQVLRSSVELHSAFLYQTPNMLCTISAITVNASIEKLPGTFSVFHFTA